VLGHKYTKSVKTRQRDEEFEGPHCEVLRKEETCTHEAITCSHEAEVMTNDTLDF